MAEALSGQEVLKAVISVSRQSRLAEHHWKDRGRAPSGYIEGMAVVFAKVYCNFKRRDLAAMDMARPESADMAKDALAWYHAQFAHVGMSNSEDGADTLRHLFVLLIGLGMRESSGKYCAGRDASAENKTSETAEAGLFQTSYNLRSASPLLPEMMKQYAGSTKYLAIFRRGVRCTAVDEENYGEGQGREFQHLCKTCPAFAAEFAALGLRHMRKHWGPIKSRAAEVLPECDEMLHSVQDLLDKLPDCSTFLGEDVPLS